MDAVIANATFSSATCADSSTSLVVTIVFEISMPHALIHTAQTQISRATGESMLCWCAL